MLKKLTLAAGFGAGYVLGAKAGQEKYAQIQAKFRELSGKPAVQNATTTVKETAAGLADSAKSTVNEKVEAKKGSTTPEPVIDLGTTTTTAPMTGASASATAPDAPRM